MSDFLEDVLKSQSPPIRHRRRAAIGLSGSTRRYAILLTLMAGLTAVPSWIILRAGVNGLGDSHSAGPVRPLLVPAAPPETSSTVAPPVSSQEPARVNPVEPPVAKERPPTPQLERRSVVDTPTRPVRKKPKTSTTPTLPVPPRATKPVEPPASTAPSAPPTTRPAKLLPSGLPRLRDVPQRPRLVEPPKVERPQVVRPQVIRPQVIRPSR